MDFQTHIQDLIVGHDQQDGGGGHGDQQGDGGGHGSGAPVCKHPWPSSSQNTSVEPSTPVLIQLARDLKKWQDKKICILQLTRKNENIDQGDIMLPR